MTSKIEKDEPSTAGRGDGGPSTMDQPSNKQLQASMSSDDPPRSQLRGILKSQSERTAVIKLLRMIDASQKVRTEQAVERRKLRKLLRMLSKARDVKLKMHDAHSITLKRLQEEEKEKLNIQRLSRQNIEEHKAKNARFEKTISSLKELHSTQITKFKFQEIEAEEKYIKEKVGLERQLGEERKRRQTEAGDNQELQNELEKMKIMYNDLVEKSEESHSRVVKAEEELLILRMSYHETTDQEKVNEHQLSDLKAQHTAEMETWKEKMTQLETEFEKANEEVSSLHTGDKAVNHLKEEQIQHEQQLSDVRKHHSLEIDTWRENFEELQARYTKAEEEISTLRFAHDETASSAEKEKLQHEQQLSDLNDYQMKEMDTQRAKFDDLQARYTKAEEETSSLRVAHDGTVNRAEMERLQHEKQLSDLNDHYMIEMDNQRENFDKLQARYTEAGEEIVSLRVANDEITSRAEKERVQHEQELLDLRNQHKLEMDNRRKTFNELQVRYAKAGEKISSLHAANDKTASRAEKQKLQHEQQLLDLRSQHKLEKDTQREAFDELEARFTKSVVEVSSLRVIHDKTLKQRKIEKQQHDQNLNFWRQKLEGSEARMTLVEEEVSALRIAHGETVERGKKESLMHMKQMKDLKEQQKIKTDSLKQRLKDRQTKFDQTKDNMLKLSDTTSNLDEKEAFIEKLSELKENYQAQLDELQSFQAGIQSLMGRSDSPGNASGSNTQAGIDGSITKYEEEKIEFLKKLHLHLQKMETTSLDWKAKMDAAKEQFLKSQHKYVIVGENPEMISGKASEMVMNSTEESFPYQSIVEIGTPDFSIEDIAATGEVGTEEDIYVKQKALLEGITAESNSFSGHIETTSGMDVIGDEILEEGGIRLENENLELDELRMRNQFLEHDRSELARVTSEILQMERESHKLKVDAAAAAAQRQAIEEFQIFQQRTHQQMKKLYVSLCTDCRQRIDSAT
jgi:hypothetical protein